MSSRVVFVLATMVAAAAAFPSSAFVRIDQYANAQNCSSGSATPTSTNYYPLDFCVVTNDGARGDKYVYDNSMNNIVVWRYSNNMCTGNTTMPFNYSVGTCNYQSGVALQNRKSTVLSSSVGLIQSSSYRVHGCGASDLEQTSFFMQGCNGGATYTVGGKLEICFPSGRGNADCSGDLTCESVGRDCFDQTSDNGADNGSIMYDWNAASTAAPAVALTAALIAFVAAVTKF